MNKIDVKSIRIHGSSNSYNKDTDMYEYHIYMSGKYVNGEKFTYLRIRSTVNTYNEICKTIHY